MDKTTVLFVCIHNSARSQMAEAFLKELGGDRFKVESAGIEPGQLNPLVVESLKELNIDISKNQTNRVSDFINEGRRYNYVVTVCDETSAERCPVFPGATKRLHWGFEDPSGFQGSKEEKLKKVRVVRDQIRQRVAEFVKTFNAAATSHSA